MRSKSPRLTIVMPFFNMKELVAQTIENIRANDFNDWELLAIDDGSTKETIDMLTPIAEKDPRIQLIQRDRMPKGAQTCRNIGLEKARGEYLVFFDSDDHVAPFCLGQRVREIAKRPELDFMVFPSGTCRDGKILPFATDYVYGYPVADDDIAAFARRQLPFIVWNNIYRTASLRSHQLTWDENLKFLQDADFNIQALLAGLNYDYAKTFPDYGYRIAYTTASVSGNIKAGKNRENMLYACDKMWASISQSHGNHYHRDLFRGVLLLYNSTFTNGIDTDLAMKMVSTLRKHSRRYARLLQMRVAISRFLGHFLPPKMSRQLPMAGHLLITQFVSKKKRERKITALRAQYPSYTQLTPG